MERDDIDLIDICTPGDTHAEIALAALGPASTCCARSRWPTPWPRPRGWRTAARARPPAASSRCAASATAAPPPLPWPAVHGRRRAARHHPARPGPVPAGLAQRENAPLTWRLDKSKSGSGALGDIGAHSIDAAQWSPARASPACRPCMETFVPERPLAGDFVGLGGHGDAGADAPRGPVTVDDAAMFTARFDGGPRSASSRPAGTPRPEERHAPGSQRHPGSLAFDFEDMNYSARTTTAAAASTRRRLPPDPRHRAASTRTPVTGGRPATGWATSTASRTRWWTW